MGKLIWQSVVGTRKWAVERLNGGPVITYQAQEYRHEHDRKPTKRFDFQHRDHAIRYAERMRDGTSQ